MGKSTINSHFPLLFVGSPEGTCTTQASKFCSQCPPTEGPKQSETRMMLDFDLWSAFRNRVLWCPMALPENGAMRCYAAIPPHGNFKWGKWWSTIKFGATYRPDIALPLFLEDGQAVTHFHLNVGPVQRQWIPGPVQHQSRSPVRSWSQLEGVVCRGKFHCCMVEGYGGRLNF